MLRTSALLIFLAVTAFCVAAAVAEETVTPGPGHGPQSGPPEGDPARRGPPRGPDQLIRRCDADGDGRVTLAELVADAKRLLADVDANEDGAITAAELEASQKARRAQRPPREGPQDGEGQRPEGRPERDQERGRSRGSRQRPEPSELFERLDTNGDGVLSLEEFAAGGRPERRPEPPR